MTGFLVDTNIVSELRKGERSNVQVRGWYARLEPTDLHLSVLTLGEIRQGILRITRRDADQAHQLELWLAQLVEAGGSRILPVDDQVAQVWAGLMVPDPRPVVDALIAATALVHDLTVATRNVRDFAPMGVRLVDPFSE